jgi:hypothetical protein
MKKIILIVWIISMGIVGLNAKDKKMLNNEETTFVTNMKVLNINNTKEKWRIDNKKSSDIQIYTNSNGVKFKSNSKIIITINTKTTKIEDIEHIYDIKFLRYMKSGDINSDIKDALFENTSNMDTANIVNNLSNDNILKIESIMPDLIFNMKTF